MIDTDVILGIILICGGVGVWRGWLREVATLAGMLLAWLILITAGGALVSVVNRLYVMAVFVGRGGFDSRQPGPLLLSLREHPLVDPRQPDVLFGVLFLILSAGVFLLANRYAAPVTGWSAQALGGLVGLANGYFFSYLSLHYLAPAQRVGLSAPLSASGVADALGRYLPTVLVAGVVVTIAIALLSSRRSPSRASVRPAPSGRGRSG